MKKIDNYNSNLINVLFFLFPLSFILGNLFINLNVFLLSIFTFIFYFKKFTKIEINIFDKVVFIFFFYIVATLILNYFLSTFINEKAFPEIITTKSLFFFRYLVFYLAIRTLLGLGVLRLDWFILTCTICAAFICSDIFFQFITGKNVFGTEPGSERHYSGIFGKELIAGGYLQRFALFSFFLPFVLIKKNFSRLSIQFIFFIFFLNGILLSGNRMSLVLFVLSFFILMFLNKKVKKYFSFILITIFLLLCLNFNFNQKFKFNVLNFYDSGKNLIDTFFVKDLRKEPLHVWQRPYVNEFNCFKHYVTNENPIFGGGLRSYRTFQGCNTHPHNYYFEIITDLGLVGLSIILFFIFLLAKRMFLKKRNLFKIDTNLPDREFIPFFLIFLMEFFPLRTSGSFFSTGNATIIFLVLAVLVSLVSKKKLYKT